MDIKIVACDMDYTLLTNDGKLPPKFDSYIERLYNAGVEFAVASGRPGYTLQQLFPKYRERFYFISDNGACIRHGEKIIYTSLMKEEDIREMTKMVLQTQTGVPIICGLDGGYYPIKASEHDSFFKRFFSIRKPVEDILHVQTQANKFTVFCPEGNAKEIMEKYYLPKYSKDYSVTLGGDVWVDIMNPDINKGSAMQQLEQYCGIKKEHIMAFGDHLNDLEMLRYVPNSYAMENAIPEVKAVAAHIAPSNEDYGVLKVLDETILSSSPA
ncbi:MAG: HAD family hydrolase [Lachnospiraceae bacterium]